MSVTVVRDSFRELVDELAERSGLSSRTVRKHLRIAECEGWIREGERADGRFEYRLTIPAHVERPYV